MRYIFISIILTISTVVSATDYFVSSSGNDSNSGLSISSPWKTIAKVNSVFSTLQPGDRVLFRRGDTFYGSLNIIKSGVAGLPITIGSYGTGDKPVITGFTTVTGWTYEGNGIYSANIISEAQTNMVLIDGVHYGMGRWPDNGYNIFEDATTNVSITDFELSAEVDWTFAEVVIRKNDWTLDRCLITDHTGNKLTYTSLGTNQNAYINHGYFIQNDLRTLTEYGEWYHDLNSGKIYVHFGTSSPSGKKIKVATLNSVIYLKGYHYITIDDIHITGSITNLVSAQNSYNNYLTIKNSRIDFAGEYGIHLLGNNGNIQNNIIADCNQSAIRAVGKNENIISNIIRNIGMIAGQAFFGTQTSGILLTDDNCIIRYNTIENISYCGIGLSSAIKIVTIQNNFINNVLLNLNDGAGVYITSAGISRIIDGNIILNAIGNISGTPHKGIYIARGIYLDVNSTNTTITNNTVANCNEAGYMLHRAQQNKLKNNTSFNNKYALLLQNASENNIRNIDLKNNIFYAKAPSQIALRFTSGIDDLLLFGTADSNYYARPIDDNNVFYTYSPTTGSKYRNLEGWQTFTDQDLNSEKSPVLLTDSADIDFYYNASTSNKVISLEKPMIDVKGTKYTGTITLLPYSSIILKPYSDTENKSTTYPSVKTIGNTTVYSSVSTQNYRRAIPVIFSETGVIESMTICHNGGSGRILMGVYSDVSGKPSKLLGVSSAATVNTTAGWQTVSLTSPFSVTSGQKVWLSWIFENAVGVRYTAGTPSRAQSPESWGGGMPSDFGTSGLADYKYSVYCSYKVGTTVSNTVGNTTVYGSISTQNYRRAIPVTFSETGIIESLSICHNGGSGRILMGVYSDASSKPSNLLGVSAVATVNTTAGWQTVSLTSPVNVNSGQTVWLSWIFENAVGVRYTTGTPSRAQSPESWSGGMPSDFGTAALADYKYSVYCSYKVGTAVSKTLGNTDVYSSISTQNYRRAIPVTFSETGIIESLSICHNGGSGRILMGVYSDASGKPSKLLGVSPASTVIATAGWQTLSLANPVSVTSGQKVWLSWIFENAVGVRYTTGTPSRAQSTDAWSGGMPSDFGTSGLADFKYSVYCTYKVGTTSTNTAGNTTIYSSVSTQNYRRAIPVTFSETGVIESLSICHNGGSGRILMGVYSDVSGQPSNLLGVSPAATVNETAGWQAVSLSSPVSVTSGQKVWLSWIFENSVGVRYTTGTPSRAQSTDAWSGGMPSDFGTSGLADFKYSVYCTYTIIDAKSYFDQSYFDSDMLNIGTDDVKTDPSETGKNRIVIYPNPTTGIVTLSMEKYYEDELVLIICDLQGRLIKTVQVKPETYNLEVDLQDKKNGFYLFMLRDIKNGMLLNRSKIFKY